MATLNGLRKTVPSPMTICSLFAVVLSACGSGGGDTSETSDEALAVGPGSSISASTEAQGATTAPKTRFLAMEGQGFSVTGVQTVRYGSDPRWVQQAITRSGECTNGFFGADPAPGIVKTCELIESAPAPTPAPSAPSPVPPLSGSSVTAWVRLAMEDQSFTTTGSQNVRFGDGGDRWVSKVVSGRAECSRNYFGSDPAYGAGKYCEVQLTVPGVVQSGSLPVVNTALIPPPNKGHDTARVRTQSAAELANAGLQPAASDIGAFREPCDYSHMAPDDPIVYPNRPGAAHLHTFFGNTQVSASSTVDSIMDQGNSTCAGGTLNRTAYWIPSLIDIRTGQPMAPTGAIFYYKQGYLGVASGAMQEFPKGLRMIVGDSKNTNPVGGFALSLRCASGSGGNHSSMPSCPIGDAVVFGLVFPQCWDGINLDSPDHISHMAYATGGGCPTTHPVPLPEITMNVSYKVTEANSAAFWRLSSDNNAFPGGYSLHADWFNGWDPAINKTFLSECVNKKTDCHAFLLGDGRILF